MGGGKKLIAIITPIVISPIVMTAQVSNSGELSNHFYAAMGHLVDNIIPGSLDELNSIYGSLIGDYRLDMSII
jgi:hypothetical protein